MTTAALPTLVQQFFTDRLCTQMAASPNTIASYRDTFRLLLRFASEQTGKAPTQLTVEQVDVTLVGDFLVHVEDKRRNSARSRNARLAAIRSFFRFVAMMEPAHLLHCQKILAMPGKRYVRRTVEFLDRAEMERALGRARSIHMGRASRSRDSQCSSPDRAQSIGDYQLAPPRHRDRNRSAHPMRWQGAQTALHASTAGDHQGTRCLAQGTGRHG